MVHFAAESHVDRSITGASDFIVTNVLGTQKLLQASLEAGVDRFVHVSTDEVYGSIDDGSWPESQPLEPNSPYSASKAGSDLVARSYHRTFGMDVRITRCSNNYGPHQFPEKVIPLFVTNLMDGLPVPLYGDGLNVRDWLHVDDHCNGIRLVLDAGRPGEVYNIGGGTELTNKELTGLHPRRDGRRLGDGHAGGGPQGPRPPLLRRHRQDRRRARLLPAGAVRAGPRRHRRLVPLERGVVAPPQGAHGGGPMTRWLVVGAAGQLGHDLMSQLGDDAVGMDLPAIDITDEGSVAAAFDSHRPDVVVNAAAYTAVDAAETDEQTALRVNGDGPAVLADACADRPGTRLVQVSTDYVFAGDASTPYDEDAPTGPRSAYGRTKLAGETAVRERLPERSWIVRTAWLYGVGGPNFVRTMLRLEREHDHVDVVDDQRGQPTSSADLARQIRLLVDAGAPTGTYHGTNAGETTWYGFTREIFRLAGADPDRVRPTTTDAFPRPAPRPQYSVLGHRRWTTVGLPGMRGWQLALADVLPAIRIADTA